jgi:Trypsin.
VVSHLVASTRDGFAKASSSCELDAMCQQDAWSVESNAVARIVYTSAGSSFLCTGTLLADRDTSSFIPYFLTANHCVSSQTVASSLQAYWFWRATACNSGARGASQTTFGGGTLLYATSATDTAFMRLATQPPAGVAYAGWIATAPTQGTAVTGIHNPAGDLQKISSGSVASFWNCAASKPEEFSCTGASAAASSFLGISWRSGLTEAGSSGSAIFTDNGHYLVGQLYGGNGSCSAPGTDFYGRFDVAYNAALSQWLGTTSASTGVTPAADFTDLWWNANESGWGLSLTQHGGALFGAWFAYDATGKSTWYVIPGGRWNTSTLFVGDVYATTGPDPTAANFDPTRVLRTKVGTATLRFSGTAQASFSYTVNGVSESRSITRQPFGNGSAVSNAFGDLWWSASESGWGLSLHQQGSTLFGVWYTYAPDGSPVWFVLPGGTWTANDTYTGTLLRTASSGAYFGRTFDPSGVVRTQAGHVTLRFLDANTALMTYSLDGVFGIKQITRQPF